MATGEPVVLFAEATTGDGNRLLRFRSSHFEAVRQAAAGARAAEAVVQPVFLDYSRVAGLPVARRDRPLFAWYGDMTFMPHFRRFSRPDGSAATSITARRSPFRQETGRKRRAGRRKRGARPRRGAPAGPKSAIPAERETS